MSSLYIRPQRLLGMLLGFGLLAFPLAFAYASVSLSIQSLSPSTNVSVGTTLSFTVSASGFSGPSYSITDSFSGGTVTNSNINSSGNFSWTPTTADVGTHNLTISVTDGSGNSDTVQEQITVSPQASLSIQSLSPGSSINTGQTLSFTAATSGFSNPTYSVSDSFSGSTVSTNDINTSGYFAWSPQIQDGGTHTITITATDSLGHSASAQEQVTVTAVPSTQIQSLSPGSSVAVGSPLSFSVATSGFASPSYTVSDSFSGSTVSNADITSSGTFSWTPTSNQVGAHTFTVYVTDSSGHSTNVSVQVTVVNPSLVVTSVSPGLGVGAGTMIDVTLSATGFVAPSYNVVDSFSGSSVTSGDVNSSGVFSWTPTTNDIGTHTLTFSSTDSVGHTATAQVTVEVTSGSVTTTTTNSGSELTSSQVAAIISLLQSFGADPTTIASVSAALGSGGTTSGSSVSDGYVFSGFLSMGTTNTEVTELQKRLTALGYYDGPITGYFGPLTKTGVIALQSAHGISQVGYVGPATRAVLND